MDFFDLDVKKSYPEIYARDTKNNVRVWWMEQDNEKYRACSGIKGGAIVVSEWTIAEAKNEGKVNETTATDQATKEIKAKYDKQLKSGGYWTDISKIDEEKFFQVMLAKSFADYVDKIDWNAGVGVQIKYNGGRIVAKKDGLWSRKGERYISIPHIEEALKPFFAKFPDAVLDGEGFNYDLREKLNEIMSLLRKTVHVTADDLKRSKQLIRFYVYDGFGFPASKDGAIVPQTAGYLERKAAIDNAFFAPCFAERYKDVIKKVPTWIVKSEAELNMLYGQFLADKQEGAIIRILGQPYENKRTKFLLKFKPIDDDEFKIISIQDGVGNDADKVSTITCQRIDGGKYSDGTDTFNATFKNIKDTEAERLWRTGEYKKLIGEIVTIQFNARTGYGKPNYARLNWENYLHDK